MLSPKLKRDIRDLWDAFWAGGLSNPITAIEQITYLIFLKRLEDWEDRRQKSIYEGEFELLQAKRIL